MSKPALYPTCRVIIGYDGAGDNVLCGRRTLDGSVYCIDHDGEDDLLEPRDDEEFADNEFDDVVKQVK